MLEGGRGSTGDTAMKNLPCQLQWEVTHRSPFSETSSFYFWSCIQDRTVGFYKFLSISWRFLSSSKSKIDVFLIISIRYFHFTGQAVHCKWIIPPPFFFLAFRGKVSLCKSPACPGTSLLIRLSMNSERSTCFSFTRTCFNGVSYHCPSNKHSSNLLFLCGCCLQLYLMC